MTKGSLCFLIVRSRSAEYATARFEGPAGKRARTFLWRRPAGAVMLSIMVMRDTGIALRSLGLQVEQQQPVVHHQQPQPPVPAAH
ncbi:MAG: hypothetical protein ACRBN8_18355 [Nannocystales bacterium]